MFVKTDPKSFKLYLVAALMLVTSNLVQAAKYHSENPELIEIFTTTELPVLGEGLEAFLSETRKYNLQCFELDGIKQIAFRLSEDLSANPDESRKIVLERFLRLREEDQVLIRNSASGLARAAQYGIDRYPAIVFDGAVVVYGLTDVHLALFQYHQWLEGQKL